MSDASSECERSVPDSTPAIGERRELRKQIGGLAKALYALTADALLDRFDALERRLNAPTASGPGTTRNPDPLEASPRQLESLTESVSQELSAIRETQGRLLRIIEDHQRTLAQELDALARRFDALETVLKPTARRSEPMPVSAEQAALWEPVIFGSAFSQDESFQSDRLALIYDLWRSDPAACALVGQLLLFFSANEAQRPQFLKDLGESFYRWRPKVEGNDHPLELALAGALEKACEHAGTRRKIDLVRIGTRFNPTYHRASERGSDVTDVLGWIVLREDGSVYQKASVRVT
jgi:hypothetical protein